MTTFATETVMALEWADACIEIVESRRPGPDDKMEQYAEWFRAVCLFGVHGGRRIKLKYFGWQDLGAVGLAADGRKATHAFLGCSNQAWILSPEEMDAILKIDSDRKAAEIAKAELEQSTAVANRQAILDEAKRTGTDQVLEHWMSECDGTVVDCSFDSRARMVRPDGTEYVTRTHCF